MAASLPPVSTIPSPPAVELRALGKTFRKKKTAGELIRGPFRPAGQIRALDGVSLSIAPGEVFGLLGPNGAGKTTLIKILAGLVLPSEGTARIEGRDSSEGRGARQVLGLVTSDERSFYWRLTGRENLRFFGRLHGMSASELKPLIPALLARVGLAEASEQAFSGYSSGMRQRLAFARALLHDPPVLLCDEPTRSLDPLAARSLRRFMQEDLNGRDGKTILLATHNLHEAAALCGRIAILSGGRIVAVDTPDRIRRFQIAAERYRLEVRSDRVVEGPGIVGSTADGSGVLRVEIRLAEGEPLGGPLGRILASGATILSCERIEPDIEEAFETLLEAARRDGESGPAGPDAAPARGGA